MKKITLSIAYVLSALAFSLPVSADQQQTDNPVVSVPPSLRDATVLIIRHAEKPDDGRTLSPAGQQRAEAYVRYFQNFQLDAKPVKLDYLLATADSKGSQRPRLTLEPLGKALGLKLDCRFKNKNFQELADEIQFHDHGRRILICWHHGQIPELVRALGADPAKLLPESKWPEDQFDWVLELRYDHEGHLIPGETRRISENLMPGDTK